MRTLALLMVSINVNKRGQTASWGWLPKPIARRSTAGLQARAQRDSSPCISLFWNPRHRFQGTITAVLQNNSRDTPHNSFAMASQTERHHNGAVLVWLVQGDGSLSPAVRAARESEPFHVLPLLDGSYVRHANAACESFRWPHRL